MSEEITYRVTRVVGSKRVPICFGLSKNDAELVADLWRKQFVPHGEVVVEQDVEVAT